MSTNTQPSAGAMRAAARIMTADDPARFTADFAAEQEQKDLAAIIDEETKAQDLIAQMETTLHALENLRSDVNAGRPLNRVSISEGLSIHIIAIRRLLGKN